jgi:hypothetical protein
MSIEAALREMLNGSAALNVYPITHGYRLQNSGLPAITFEITNNERSAVSGHWLASAQIKVVALETGTALTIAADVPAACVPASYLFGSYTFDAVIFRGRTADAASVGEGDEQEPAEVNCEVDIYYREN